MEDFFDSDLLFRIFFILETTLLVVMLIVFSIHRRNMFKRVIELEERMHTYDSKVFSQMEEQFDLFKTGLMAHLSEMGDRIGENEALTRKVYNLFDELQEAWDELNEHRHGQELGSQEKSS